MGFDINKYHFRSSKIFDGISDEDKRKIDAIKRIQKIKKGDIIYKEASFPKAVYGLKKGRIKIEQVTEEGVQRIVYIYTKGEYFGFRPLLCNEKHPVSAIALDDSEIEIFEGNTFVKIAKQSSILSFNLLEILSFEFNVWINLIASLSHKSAKERVALILLILNEKYIEDNLPASITISKADIARYSETTEETVVRVIGFFEEKKIVKNFGRKFSVLNKALLEIIAEGF